MKKIGSKNNFKSKTAIYTSAGLIVIAGAGTAGYFIAQTDNKSSLSHFNYSNSFTQKIREDVKLENYPIDNKENNNKFFLSEKDFTRLKNKINTDLQYGPELADIKSISIDNKNIFDTESTLGAYIPSMDKININTTAWRGLGLTSVSKNELNDIQADTKIKLIFQVLFHEYGHFLADEYINSEPKTSLVSRIYSFQSAEEGEKNQLTNNNWNKNFYSTFKRELNYDIPQKPAISLYPSTKQLATNSTENISVAEMFNEVNNTNKSKLVSNDLRVVSDDKYYYSMDELFTRKYQEILMPSYGTQKDAVSWFSPEKEAFLYSPYGIDVEKNKEDNPFFVSNQLYKLLGHFIGYSSHNNISHISMKDGKIIIGGYTDFQDSKLLVDGKSVDGVSVETHKLQIKLNKFTNLKNTGGIDLGNNKKEDGASKYFWVTSPIDISKILEKPLSLSSGKSIIVLDSDGELETTVSTYRAHQPSSNNYHVSIKNGIVKIISGRGN